MKITCSKRDDVLKRKAEYEAKYDAYQKDHKERHQKYYRAKEEAMEPIKAGLESKLAHEFSALEFEVRVSRGFGPDYVEDSNTVDVRILVNDRNHFDENSALSWNYDVKIRDGEVVKETSSWSGLKACTEAQMESLRQTVRALEWLNSVDWADMLVADFPDYDSFYEGALTAPEREEFGDELTNATIADLIGTNKYIKVTNFQSSPYAGRWIWINPIGETNSQWKVRLIADWAVQNRDHYDVQGKSIAESPYEQRVRKSNISIPNIDNPDIIEV